MNIKVLQAGSSGVCGKLINSFWFYMSNVKIIMEHRI